MGHKMLMVGEYKASIPLTSLLLLIRWMTVFISGVKSDFEKSHITEYSSVDSNMFEMVGPFNSCTDKTDKSEG